MSFISSRSSFIAVLCICSSFIWAETPAEKPDATITETGLLPLQELRTFTQVFDQIRKAYVEEIDDKTLLENAIIGMLAELDPHSTYLDHTAFDSLQEHSTGEFGGLGMEVGMEDGLVKVITPIDDTPAHKAGVKAGDLILKLDDQFVQGMNLQDAIELMRGATGEPILLTIAREGEDKPLEIEVIRDIIKVKSVRSSVLEESYGYVRISQFQEHTGIQFVEALESLKEEAKPLQGLVIDLRNNPGGILGASIEVADALLDKGKIVLTKGRLNTSNGHHDAMPGDILGGLPVVVIINGGSASASEIVAGALQDNKRAIIIGTSSFGKGSVQTVLPISEGRGIKLTTARYYTPSGRSIQAEGIVPDIEIQDAELRIKNNGVFVKEKNLTGHLNNDKSESAKELKTTKLDGDYQLYEALNLLKGAKFLNQKNEN